MSAMPGRIGKYIIESEVGRGGMGVVYRGLDPIIQRPVALKTIIKSQLDPVDQHDLLQRFKREAQAAGRLLHPNIVSVYEYGEDAEHAFIAMEFIQGRGLNEYLSRGEPMPAERAKSVVEQMLAALDYAHKQGVVHRDIKPSNLMMTKSWEVKVSDFGIAQIDSFKLTQMGTVLGTPSYMSPEQFRGGTTDLRADVFSAGVAFYEMLTGFKPFVGDSVGALAHAVVNIPPVPPTQHNNALDIAFDEVLLKALAPDPAQRFVSARDFALAMKAAFEGQTWHGPEDLDATVPVIPVATTASRSPATPTPTRKIDFSAVSRKIDTSGVRATTAGGVAAGPLVPKARVLFVDDEERILSALKLLFKNLYEVHVTTDAAEALEMLKAQHFHLLVSDQRMPNMNGTELLSKAKMVSPNTVRILLTGYSDLAAIIGSINEGEVYRFANKPWNTTEIRALLADAVAIGIALEDAPPPVVGADLPSEAVLIVDDDREVYLAAKDLFGSSYRILYAPDLLTALELLRDESVAVLVADIEGGQQNNRTLFKMLKREHPQILTIAMTGASDSDLVIELINQAQIFRFLNKPVKLATLQQHVAAAMVQFQRYKMQPKLLLKQKVAKPAAEEAQAADESGIGKLILGTLSALRKRLSGG
jgi:eukaryotic-like serine/threonine-protein kinase